MVKSLVSIVIPTYKEFENIKRVVLCIHKTLVNIMDYEIIFVDDDSADGSLQVCLDLDKTYPVKMIVRIDKRGLSSAVIDGISQAKGKYIVVMDGDLSHPASAIPSMIKKIDTPLQVDFKELSGEIIRLMGNDNLRHFYANNLNMRVIKYFNIDRYVSELHGLYRSLL